MAIKSPKEMIKEVTSLTDKKKREAFKIRTESTVNGAFWGGAFGLMIAYYKDTNKYMGALIGASIGALVSNMLTVQKKEN